MRASLGLGLRLVRAGGRAGWIRLAVTVAAGAFATVVLVGVTAVPGAVEARRAREAAREPSPELVDASASTRIAQVRDRWRGRTIFRVLVEAVPGGPVPPGLKAIPAPGTSAVSPGLAAAIAKDPSLGRRVARPVGRIGRGGLVSDRDLLAYVGVPPGALGSGAQEVQRFGLPPRLVETISPQLLWTLMFGFTLFVLAPVAGVIVAATRLAAATRARRWQALLVLGASGRQVRMMVASESLVGSAGGAVLGIGLLAAAPRSGSLTVGATSVFASDLRPALGLTLVVALAMPLVAAAVAVLAANGASRLPRSTRPTRGSGRRVWLAGAALPVGVAILVAVLPATHLLGVSSGARQQLLYAAVVFSVAGMASVLGPAVQTLAGRMAPARRRSASVIALRSLAADPGAFTRMVGLLCTVVLALGVAEVVGTQFGPDRAFRSALVEQQRNGGRPLAQLMSSMGTGMDVASLDERDGVRLALPTPQVFDQPAGDGIGSVIVATCDQLDAMAPPVRGCVDGRIGQVVGAGGPPARLPAEVVVEGTAGWVRVDASAPSLVRAALPEAVGLDGALLVPPGIFDDVGGPSVRIAEVLLTSAPDALERLRGAAPALQPDTLVQVPFDTAGVDDHAANARWVELAAGATLMLGSVGLVLTALDGISGRRPRVAALSIVGAPQRVLRECAFQEVLWPSLLGVGLSVGMVILTGVAFVAQGRGDRVDPSMVVRLTATFVAFSTVLAGVTCRRIRTRLRPELLRRE